MQKKTEHSNSDCFLGAASASIVSADKHRPPPLVGGVCFAGKCIQKRQANRLSFCGATIDNDQTIKYLSDMAISLLELKLDNNLWQVPFQRIFYVFFLFFNCSILSIRESYIARHVIIPCIISIFSFSFRYKFVITMIKFLTANFKW